MVEELKFLVLFLAGCFSIALAMTVAVSLILYLLHVVLVFAAKVSGVDRYYYHRKLDNKLCRVWR